MGTWRQLAEWGRFYAPNEVVHYQVVMMTHPYSQGEVDIVEGVNDQVPNASSLHTSPGI